MTDFFKRPEIFKEAAEVSKTETKPEPGQPMLIEILLGFLVPLAGACFQFVGTAGGGMLNALHDPAIFEACKAGSIMAALGTGSMRRLLTLIMTLLPTLFCIFFAKLLQNRKIRTLGFVKKRAVLHYLLGLVIGAAMFGGSVLICMAFGSVKIHLNPSGYSLPMILILFLGWMIQGNSEETVCRGTVLVSASRRFSMMFGLMLNSVVFACLHLMNPGITPLAFLNLLLFGVVMSAVFIRTGNIWMVSAIHTVWNFVQGNVFGVLVSGGVAGDTILVTESLPSLDIINGGSFGLEGGLGVTIVLLVTTLILFFVKPAKADDIKNAK